MIKLNIDQIPEDVREKIDKLLHEIGNPRFIPGETDPREYKLRCYGEGPWVDEPDEMIFPHGWIFCEITRNMDHGSLCGYIHLPKYHVWIKYLDYKEWEIPIEVHGGVTYFQIHDNQIHVGFDCGHSGDFMPHKLMRILPYRNVKGFYKDIEFVKQQCILMADQAIEAAENDANMINRILSTNE